ncbi:MAG: SDR family oxidoreductase [Parachlamydia sp.]|jgi:uncharacterized protein YbjT (DUF2867 family)|nr:SDR family oxidoreductase [Parachlamydia sp.]
MTKVLVTGANGFVGKRLALHLSGQGHEVIALCRIKGASPFPEEHPNLHCHFGDIRNPQTFEALPNDIEAAYYLVHSMSEIVSDLLQTELEVVRHFLEGMESKNVKQIIYLGGIINDEQSLSPHLRSRLSVEKALQAGSIPVTVLRSSVIIGAGSASFEILRDLCEKLPVMVAPKWVHALCQPIAIRDVLYYLSAVLLKPECYHQIFDIGGPEVFTFKKMMMEYCRFRGLKRRMFVIPLLTPRLSSYWLIFITSVRFSLCYYLVESMKSNTVVQKAELQKSLRHQSLTYLEALELAFQRIDQNEVVSSWMDSWDLYGKDPSLQTYIDVPQAGCYKDERKAAISDSKEATIQRLWQIGGKRGYYGLNWAWSLRGLLDKLVGGVGLNRGRRHPSEIVAGDSIDFWRVILADKESGRLILFATMRTPGEAWLDFKLEEGHLVQTATFRPKGLMGRLYWYAMSPFHAFIFGRMAKSLAGEIQ